MNVEDLFHFVAPKVRDAAIKTAVQLEQYAADLLPLFDELVDESLAQ